MKKLLYLAIAILVSACLSGCEMQRTNPGQVIKSIDKYYGGAGETYVIWIEGHKKYLWTNGKQAGITCADDCPCREEMMGRLLDSIREIVQEEVKVRVILSREGK